MRGYIPGSFGSSGKDGQEGKTHETEIWVVPSDWHILCSYLPLAGGGGVLSARDAPAGPREAPA